MTFLPPPPDEPCWVIAADSGTGVTAPTAYIASSSESTLSNGKVVATWTLNPAAFGGNPLPLYQWDGTGTTGSVATNDRLVLVSGVAVFITVNNPSLASIINARMDMTSGTTVTTTWNLGAENPVGPRDMTANPPSIDLPWNQNTGSPSSAMPVMLRGNFESTVPLNLSDVNSGLTITANFYPWVDVGGGLHNVSTGYHDEFTWSGSGARLHSAYVFVSSLSNILGGAWVGRRQFE